MGRSLFGLVVAGTLMALPCFALAQIAPTRIPSPNPVTLPAVADAKARLEIAAKPIHLKKIILVGDSTVQAGSGWGGRFCASHVQSSVICVNMGRAGRSSLSYRLEGGWRAVLSEIAASEFSPVYVLIQFGHNDVPGRPGRTTDLATEFPDNLRRYVAEVRAAGGTPVLVTPLTRRAFVAGSLQDDLAPWAEQTSAVARALSAPLVDLHASSVASVQAMGPEKALTLAMLPPPQDQVVAARLGTSAPNPPRPNFPESPASGPRGSYKPVFDHTHLGDEGAEVFAAQVARALADAVPALQDDLVP